MKEHCEKHSIVMGPLLMGRGNTSILKSTACARRHGMATAATIAAAAISAAGAIGGGALAAQGASSAARAARPRRQTVPIPPYAKAGQELVARDLALNMNAVR